MQSSFCNFHYTNLPEFLRLLDSFRQLNHQKVWANYNGKYVTNISNEQTFTPHDERLFVCVSINSFVFASHKWNMNTTNIIEIFITETSVANIENPFFGLQLDRFLWNCAKGRGLGDLEIAMELRVSKRLSRCSSNPVLYYTLSAAFLNVFVHY